MTPSKFEDSDRIYNSDDYELIFELIRAGRVKCFLCKNKLFEDKSSFLTFGDSKSDKTSSIAVCFDCKPLVLNGVYLELLKNG